MKKRLLQMAVVAFGLSFGISSCSKDDSLGRQPSSLTKEDHKVHLNLEIEGEETDLAQTARSADGSRALTLEADPNRAGKYRIAEGSNWRAHVFYKHRSTHALGYMSYQLQFGERLGNNNIKLKPVATTGLTLTMFNGAAAPTDSEISSGDWSIAVVLGGGKLEGTKLVFDSDQVTGLTADQVEAPLVMQWKTLSISGTQPFASGTFKPQGIIMRISLTNKTGYSFTEAFPAGWLEQSEGNVHSTGTYDFSAINVGQTVKYSASTRTDATPVLMHQPVANNATTYSYRWIAVDASQPNYKFRIEPTGYFLYRKGTHDKFVYDSTTATADKKLGEGKRAEVALTMERPPKMPIDYMSDYQLAGGASVNPLPGRTHPMAPDINFTGTTGELRKLSVTEQTNAFAYGYYRGYHVLGKHDATYNPSTANLQDEIAATASLAGYRIPEDKDWWGIILPIVDITAWAYDAVVHPLYNRRPDNGYNAFYESSDQDVYPVDLYEFGEFHDGGGVALRFLPTASQSQVNRNFYPLLDNSHISAFRYTYHKYTPSASFETDVNMALVIESVHLGEEGKGLTAVDLDDAWWARNSSRIVKKILPLAFMVMPDGNLTLRNGAITNRAYFSYFTTTELNNASYRVNHLFGQSPSRIVGAYNYVFIDALFSSEGYRTWEMLASPSSYAAPIRLFHK